MKSGDPQFRDAKGKIKFIRVIDQLFNLLNSRSAFSKGFKKPLFLFDSARKMSIIDNATQSLICLSDG